MWFPGQSNSYPTGSTRFSITSFTLEERSRLPPEARNRIIMQELSPYGRSDRTQQLSTTQYNGYGPPPRYLNVTDFRLVLLKHIGMIALVFAFTVLGTACGVFLLVNPMYTSESTLLIEPHAPN